MDGGKIVLLSGPICSGKSTLAQRLAERFGFKTIKTTDFVKLRKKKGSFSRDALQKYGQRLDNADDGQWLLADFAKEMHSSPTANVVVDSVRTKSQINRFRDSYGRRVVHIHLSAPIDVLTERYNSKPNKGQVEFPTYAETQRNRTEKFVGDLAKTSDIVIDTVRSRQDDVFERAASLLSLYGDSQERLVDVLIGGQYGSEGKGNVASYLAPEYQLLVRVGGPNAGHKVKLPGGKEYTFQQLPSGTGSCEADLVIGPGAVIDPDILIREINELKIGVDRLSIDPQAMLINTADIKAEARLRKDIASTASGTGYAAARRIMYRGNKKNIVELVRDHPVLKAYAKRSALEVFEDAYRAHKKIFLEGTQGSGLSLYHGYYPHVTSRDTTVSGCLAEAGISSARVRRIVMVCRTYPIRVPDSKTGTSGPMSPDISRDEIARRSDLPLSELQEITSVTKGKRRIGEFDWHLLRKSTTLNSPTDIALTFADYLNAENQKARRFDQLTPDTIRFIEEVERFAKAPVSLISTRFHVRSIIDRRSW